MKNQYVRDWMTADPIVVSPDTLLSEAFDLMIQNTVRRLPVVHNGRLVGILTYGDIREVKPGNDITTPIKDVKGFLELFTAREAMTTGPICISPNSLMGEAAQLMMNNMIGGLPVIDENDTLQGILTESDLFRMVAQKWAGSAAEKTTASQPFSHYAD